MGHILNHDKQAVQPILLLDFHQTGKNLFHEPFCFPMNTKTIFEFVVLFLHQGMVFGA